MTEEFRRFGLARFRRLVGWLEVAGALGLIVGFAVRPIAVVSAAGLTLLMVGAVAARVRARDSVLQTMPALLLLFANAFISFRAFQGMQTP